MDALSRICEALEAILYGNISDPSSFEILGKYVVAMYSR